jgi:outer membrane protein assembly factor BamB
MKLLVPCAIFLSTFWSVEAIAQHRVLLGGEGRLAIVSADGEIEWEMPWGGIHDIHVLDNGHIMVQERYRKIVEIDPDKKEVVWSYDASKSNGNDGKRLEIHAFQPLNNGRIMIAESGPARIIEIDRDGNLLHEVALKVDNPHPHRDTRLARKIENGNYLACHEADGTVREYDRESGEVIWEFRVPMFDKESKPGHGPEAFGNALFSALRLPNGNTLIGTGNGHSILEVTPEKKIVREIHQNDLPGITLAWVTTIEVLANGNLVIGNCHAGPGQPLLVEIEPKTNEVVWTFDHFDAFGNSVSNSLLLDAIGASTR